MRVEIVSTKALMWEGEATSVVVPSIDGYLGILPGRQPVLAVLAPGTVTVVDTGGEQRSFDVQAGFVSMDEDVEIVIEIARICNCI